MIVLLHYLIVTSNSIATVLWKAIWHDCLVTLPDSN